MQPKCLSLANMIFFSATLSSCAAALRISAPAISCWVGVCGSYRLELLFDILTQSPVTNEREVLKHQLFGERAIVSANCVIAPGIQGKGGRLSLG